MSTSLRTVEGTPVSPVEAAELFDILSSILAASRHVHA